jgi:large subunit ribosomal protein L9e
MKLIQSSDIVKFPEGIKFVLNNRVVKVTGPRGTLTRDFRHLNVEIVREKKDIIRVRKWFGIRKELAAIRTVCSHIVNMIKGVTKGYRYKMRSVYAHFPINISLQEKNTVVEVD